MPLERCCTGTLLLLNRYASYTLHCISSNAVTPPAHSIAVLLHDHLIRQCVWRSELYMKNNIIQHTCNWPSPATCKLAAGRSLYNVIMLLLLLIVRVCVQVAHAYELRDTDWSTYNCALGWAMRGAAAAAATGEVCACTALLYFTSVLYAVLRQTLNNRNFTLRQIYVVLVVVTAADDER
jgi:hypothetical protein